MRAIITVDLGFGDAGKGATVDALVRKHNSDLVVRYNGGCQAAHHVQLPDGRRHCFSQFGSGTLAGARTYIGPHVIINPFLMRNEAVSLAQNFGLYPTSTTMVHPDCLVATPMHAFANRVEDSIHFHGTCGLGIGKTRKYWIDYGSDAITVADLTDEGCLRRKLSLLKERLLAGLGNYWSGLTGVDTKSYTFLRESSPVEIARSLRDEWGLLKVSVIEYMPYSYNPVIFEGSQGVLLDQRVGFHPHTTWSDLTAFEAYEILNNNGGSWETEVLGITRAYHTRHGNGPLPTYSRQEAISRNFAEGNDDPSSAAGKMRAGPLDLQLLKYAIGVVRPHSVAVTCLDHLPEKDILYGRGYDVPKSMHWDTSDPKPMDNLLAQTSLTGALQQVTVNYDMAADREHLLQLIEARCPISSVADGPTYEDRAWK